MPSLSLEALPSKLQARSVQSELNAAVGASLTGSAPLTVTTLLSEPVAPASSVTVSVTV